MVTMTGKVELTVVRRTLTDTLPTEGKPQKVIANGAGCSQSAVSKHVQRKLELKNVVEKGVTTALGGLKPNE